jgi:hypothetical protein
MLITRVGPDLVGNALDRRGVKPAQLVRFDRQARRSGTARLRRSSRGASSR